MSDRDPTAFAGGRGVSAYDHDPFDAFHHRMDHLFDAVGNGARGRSFAPSASTRWVTIDLNETDQAYTVTAELPGIEARDIELTLRDNALTLSGEKRDEQHEGEGERVYLERSYGRFKRSISFAAEVDADRIDASCKNGVLTVTLPKNPDAKDKARRIEVRGGVS